MRLMQASLIPAVVALLSACGESTGSGASLAGLALEQSVSGYGLQRDASGPLSADLLAAATPAAPDAVRAELERLGLRGAYQRTWTSGDDFVDDIVVDFATHSAAADFVAFEAQAVQSGGAGSAYTMESVPGARAFVLVSTTRAGGRTAFCRGAWFAVATRAYEVLSCGAAPTAAQYADGLVELQYQRAVSPRSASTSG